MHETLKCIPALPQVTCQKCQAYNTSKQTFFPRKLEAAPSAEQVLLFCGGTKRLHCAVWVGTVYHDGYDMHFFRFRDLFHSKFFLTLGNIRLFQVIDNRSFQGIESAPVQVNGKSSY